MKNSIIKTQEGYIMNAADGVRIITRDEASHNLIGILTTTPAVGQAVIRFLTGEEQAEYARVRRSERNIIRAAKQAEADKARKADEKSAAKKERQEKQAAAKAERKASEAERKELREIRDELKKLEEKPAVEEAPAKEPNPRKALQEQLRQAKAFLTAAEGTDCEFDAKEAVDFAYAELAKYDAEHPTVKPEKPAVNPAEPIGKPPYADTVGNKEEEVAPMKDVTNTKRLIAVLRQAKLPADVVEAVCSKFTVTDLRKIVFADLREELTVIKGVGEKRAETIIRVLEGRIPEPLAIKKLTAEMREQLKAEIREKAEGFNCRTYEYDELWRDVMPLCQAIMSYKYDFVIDNLCNKIKYCEDDEEYDKLKAECDKRKAADKKALEEQRKNFKILEGKVLVDAPLVVRRNEGRIIRLTKSMTSLVMGIDCKAKRVTDSLFVLNHGIQEVFSFNWKIFADNKEEGEEKLAEFQKKLMHRLGWHGVVAVGKDGTNRSMFGVCGASAGHQKNGKVLMGKAKIMKENQKLFWFGKTMDDFAATMDTSGAELLKARANMLRPWMKPFMLADGTVIKFRRVLVVKDVKKLYKLLVARIIGKQEDKSLFKDGPAEFEAILGDGAMIAIRKLLFQGQCSGALFKGFLADGTSSIEELCRKHHIDIEKFFNIMIEGIDGKMHRLGDFDVICGDGCWKGDKVFESYDAYCDWLDEMAESYEGIDNLYLLRQAEEIEDEEKARTLTRTLIQQFMFMTPAERKALTKSAIKSLKNGKTLSGAIRKLAALWKAEKDRNEVEKLFAECPWLIMAPAIQEYLGESWKRKQIEAVSGKFKTQGQYPYIMQDPVALLEVWVLKMDPNDPTLGVLGKDEVSCADVPHGRKLLCVRFPANFLTAQVRRNAAFTTVFHSLNGVMVLSVHDDILIIQDGDVDGDEMCVIYNRLAIRLIERMLKKFNPPAILFDHGKKGSRSVAGDKKAFMNRVMDSLWDAEHYDKVGIYANLATKCAYLAAIALKRGNEKLVDQYLLWMSAASTGAIIAIDQVKGTTVDKDLIAWLENIGKEVNKAMRAIAKEAGIEDVSQTVNPFIQWYVDEAKRKPSDIATRIPSNPDNFLDEIGSYILAETGEWSDFDSEGANWNKIAAKEAFISDMTMMQVPYAKISKEMIELLGENWFKLRAKTEDELKSDKTAATLRKLACGTEIGLKEFALLMWRNEAAMAYIMEGRQLWEKKEEYIGVCRELLKMLVENADWTKKDCPAERRWDVLVDCLVRDALELETKSNNVENKGSWAWFVLRVVAPDLRTRVKASGVSAERFSMDGTWMDSVIYQLDAEMTEYEQELFETAPVRAPEEDEPPVDVSEMGGCWSICSDINPDELPDDMPEELVG